MFNSTEWITKVSAISIADDFQGNQEIDALYQKFIAATFDCGRIGDLSPIDAVLGALDPGTVNHFFPVSTLRATFRLHRHLTNWTAFRDKTVHVYLEREWDMKELSGLLDTAWYVSTLDTTAFNRLIGQHPELD